LTTPLEGKDVEKERTEKVLSPVHTVTVRADEQDISEDEGEQVGEKDVGRWRISVLWRTFLERFETGGHRQMRETGKRNERAKQTRRPDEASTIWEMKCRGIGKV